MAQETGVELRATTANEDDRSIEEIRQNIEQTRQNISGTVDLLGEKLQRQLDWREYVRKKPLVAVGIGLGVGVLVSRIVVSRPHPRHNISDLVADTLSKSVTRIFQPKRESVLQSTLKLLGGALIAQYTQASQPVVEQVQDETSQQYAQQYNVPPRPMPPQGR